MPGVDGTLRGTLRLEFHDDGAGKTRLELRQGPFEQEIGDQTQGGLGELVHEAGRAAMTAAASIAAWARARW